MVGSVASVMSTWSTPEKSIKCTTHRSVEVMYDREIAMHTRVTMRKFRVIKCWSRLGGGRGFSQFRRSQRKILCTSPGDERSRRTHFSPSTSTVFGMGNRG